MTQVTVQINNFQQLNEALRSDCDGIRFGAEFCEWKIAPSELLQKAYEKVVQSGKEFVYVTPRTSNRNFEMLQRSLSFLNDQGKPRVVINDFGVLRVLSAASNLRPHLGRQLIYTPARCPWEQITETKKGVFVKRRVAKLFYQTSLNYPLTVQFFQHLGVKSGDVDWIPSCFPHYHRIADTGFDLSLHLHLVPVTLTRKCHTARFLDESGLDNCHKLCHTKTFRLEQESLNLQLFLDGNVVYQQKSLNGLRRVDPKKIAEFVITMSPLTHIESHHEVNSLINKLRF
jgi:hypothetical protein